MDVTTGLVIREPWLDLILSGEKTWEMRSAPTRFRGWFGLIRKGSGVVCGVARMADVGVRLSLEEMLASVDKHRIPEATIRSGTVADWTVPWVLDGVLQLQAPVPYRHRSGAVKWVTLDSEVSQAIAGLLDQPARSAEPVAPRPDKAVPTRVRAPAPTAASTGNQASTPRARSGMWGESEITQGNLDNAHFYLRSFLDRFPPDLIGGSNKSTIAPRSALIDWGGNAAVETDIDGEKKFFRRRGWLGSFFAANNAEPGDRVRVEETAPYRYRVTLRKRGTL